MERGEGGERVGVKDRGWVECGGVEARSGEQMGRGECKGEGWE